MVQRNVRGRLPNYVERPTPDNPIVGTEGEREGLKRFLNNSDKDWKRFDVV